MNSMPGQSPSDQHNAGPQSPVKLDFPNPSLTLIEFGDALGMLIAARTEKDPEHRRLVLKKTGYLRITPNGWGVSGYQEVWIQQNKNGFFLAVEPSTKRVFRHPSRRRYEFGFLSKDVFDCALKNIRERRIQAIYELMVVLFGSRQDFSVEAGGLLAPDDYASETSLLGDDLLVASPKLNA